MGETEQPPQVAYETHEYLPHAEVETIEKKGRRPAFVEGWDGSRVEFLPDETGGTAKLDDPVTDRNGRAPNPPPILERPYGP
jgi:hypothetical protein